MVCSRTRVHRIRDNIVGAAVTVTGVEGVAVGTEVGAGIEAKTTITTLTTEAKIPVAAAATVEGVAHTATTIKYPIQLLIRRRTTQIPTIAPNDNQLKYTKN